MKPWTLSGWIWGQHEKAAADFSARSRSTITQKLMGFMEETSAPQHSHKASKSSPSNALTRSKMVTCNYRCQNGSSIHVHLWFTSQGGYHLCFVISIISISPWQVAPCCVQSRADVLVMIMVTDFPPWCFINHSSKKHKRPSKMEVLFSYKQACHCQKSAFIYMLCPKLYQFNPIKHSIP